MNSYRKKPSLFPRVVQLGVLSCISASSVVWAQVTANDTSRQENDLVITATRTASRADDLLSDVVVINRASIEKYQGSDLASLLSREAGIQISNNGGIGRQSSLFIRGANASQTLLLVDGVRLGNVFFGSPELSNIPLEMVEKIEVLRGPASSLYGSDAIGGVIQIFTKQQQGTSAKVTVGSDHSASYSLSTGGRQGQLDYSFGAAQQYVGGFSTTLPGSMSYSPDRDPYRQLSFNAGLNWRFQPDWSLGLRMLNSQAKTYLDFGPSTDTIGDFVAEVNSRSRTKTETTTVSLRGKPTSRWRTSFTLAESSNKVTLEQTPEGFGMPNFDSQDNSKQQQLVWQNDVQTAAGLTSLGVERLQEKIASSEPGYVVQGRDVNSVFTGLNGSSERHFWQANLRQDDNSQYGGQGTYLASYGYQVNDLLRLRGSQSTSFRAPELISLYGPYGANPLLKSEEGKNIEVGADINFMSHVSKISLFRNSISNLIVLDSNFVPQNVAMAELKGLSLTDQFAYRNIQFKTLLDFLDPTDEASGKRLQRRAKRQLSFSADYSFERWTVGTRLLMVGQRFEDRANQVSLGGFSTMDIYTKYRVDKNWSTQLSVNNLADKDYQTARFFQQAGRQVFLSLVWQPSAN